jgi:hypothetical protein
VSGTEVVPADEEPTTTAIERAGTRVEVAAPVTLFRTDEPALIVARATQVADVLSDVLRSKKLTKRIGDKDVVLVEGWTLCGSMLGVFPIVEWTRKLPNGWEARVEVKTRDGDVVGSAEAQCTRDEKEWGPNPTRGKQRDDYALRSMAQTRATSKALRGPLGFVVHLAGFNPTPAEELIGTDADREFDPGRDLLDGAISGEGFLDRLGEAFRLIDATVDWKDVLNQISGDSAKDDQFWRRVSNAVAWLGDLTAFPGPSDDKVIEAFAWAFEGTIVELTRPIEEAHEEMDEQAATAAGEEEPAPIPSDTPLPDDDDDVPFGPASGDG